MGLALVLPKPSQRLQHNKSHRNPLFLTGELILPGLHRFRYVLSIRDMLQQRPGQVPEVRLIRLRSLSRPGCLFLLLSYICFIFLSFLFVLLSSHQEQYKNGNGNGK